MNKITVNPECLREENNIIRNSGERMVRYANEIADIVESLNNSGWCGAAARLYSSNAEAVYTAANRMQDMITNNCDGLDEIVRRYLEAEDANMQAVHSLAGGIVDTALGVGAVPGVGAVESVTSVVTTGVQLGVAALENAF